MVGWFGFLAYQHFVFYSMPNLVYRYIKYIWFVYNWFPNNISKRVRAYSFAHRTMVASIPIVLFRINH